MNMITGWIDTIVKSWLWLMSLLIVGQAVGIIMFVAGLIAYHNEANILYAVGSAVGLGLFFLSDIG